MHGSWFLKKSAYLIDWYLWVSTIFNVDKWDFSALAEVYTLLSASLVYSALMSG